MDLPRFCGEDLKSFSERRAQGMRLFSCENYPVQEHRGNVGAAEDVDGLKSRDADASVDSAAHGDDIPEVYRKGRTTRNIDGSRATFLVSIATLGEGRDFSLHWPLSHFYLQPHMIFSIAPNQRV